MNASKPDQSAAVRALPMALAGLAAAGGVLAAVFARLQHSTTYNSTIDFGHQNLTRFGIDPSRAVQGGAFMFQLKSGRTLWGVAAGILAMAAVGATAAAVWQGNEASSLDPNGGWAASLGTSDSGELARMLGDASDEAGFELKVPDLPAGFIVEGLRTWPAHTPGAGGSSSTFRHAELFVKGPDFGFQITQTNRPVNLVGSPRQIGGTDGDEHPIFLEESDQAKVYTLITADRSYSLAIASQHTFAEKEAIAVLRSMAMR